MKDTLRVVDIVAGTTVDGPGFRTSIYFAGCEHHCDECHNPQTWDRLAGRDMTVDEIFEIIKQNDFDVTFTGGDPLLQVRELISLAKKITDYGKNIWCYTGYLYETISTSEQIVDFLEYIEVLVDGPFIKGLADVGLLFRGSSNQRLISVKDTLKNGKISSWESDF